MTKRALFLVFLAAFLCTAEAQTPPRFTAGHTLDFKTPTDQERRALSSFPSLRDLVAENFEIAREDLNDDGSKEVIVVAASSVGCGASGSCATVVLENRGGRTVAILENVNLQRLGLAVTNEKVGQYRALANVDGKGVILLGEQRGTPMFGKQLVFPMDATGQALPGSPAAGPPRSDPQRAPPNSQRPAAPVTLNGPPVCGSQPLCTETLSFAATVTDFQATLQNTMRKTLTARINFKNKLTRPLTLGFVRGSGVATDDRGNRYTVQDSALSVQGMGQVIGNTADPKFLLQPGESSDARFEFVWNSSGREIFGLSFQADLAIREIDPMPGNQIVLGREHALHYSGLGERAPSAPAPTRTVAPSPSTDPSARADATPRVDPCGAAPHCYSAGPFVAELANLTASFSNNNAVHVLQANVRLRNNTNQPLVLAYVAGSAVITDNNGSRYTVEGNVRGDGATGIGTATQNEADPRFRLAPGATGNATFTVSRYVRANGQRESRIGSTFSFNTAITELEVLPSRQIQSVREYPVSFTKLTASGAGILQQILQGLPKK